MLHLGIALAADLVAITTLSYGLYYRRHFRRDLALAFVALNVGVLVVTALLSGGEAGLGLGLGLFGILSIIRLRSDAITQEEIAYYFISLALGLVAGLHTGPMWLAPALAALLVAVMWLADHPAVGRGTKRQTVTLDAAYPHEATRRQALADLLEAQVLQADVIELDLVRDLTVVDVRFRLPGPARPGQVQPTPARSAPLPAAHSAAHPAEQSRPLAELNLR